MLDGMKVLLAEDNPTNVLVARHMLESLGASVTVSHDGLEAVATAGREPYDLLLIDIEMPGMSGGDVIRHVRNGAGPNAGTTVIALTAYVGPAERAAVQQSGADGLISKPLLSIDGFGQEILDIMRGRRVCAAREASGDRDVVAWLLDGRPLGDVQVFDASVMDGFARLTGPDRVQGLIAQALSDLSVEVATLSTALDEGDDDTAAAAAHKLCGMAGAVGAQRLDAVVKTVQTRGLFNRNPPLSAFISAVWHDTEQELRSWKPS
ncbi:MAG: response regulator [Pseudomonadota bacterium]